MDSISSDIKNLENKLRSYGVCVPFHFPVSRGSFFGRERENELQVFYFQEATFLSWIEIDGTFRLTFSHGEIAAEYVDGACRALPMWDENIRLINPVPLIETKAKQRLEIHWKLSEFLDAFTQEIDLLGERYT